MKWLNSYKIRLMLIGFVAAIVLSGGRASADFTFGEPTNLGPTVNSSAYESGSNLSADGLELYFRSERPGGYGSDDLWVARRPTKNDAWEDPVNLGPVVNNSYSEGQPNISVDGLTLYFNSDQPGGYGGQDLWLTRRPTTNDPWGEPVNLGPTVNSSVGDSAPSISADGLLLFLHSERTGGYGGRDLWVTTRATTEDEWGTLVNLGPAVNSSTTDSQPSISVDGLCLFFHSKRPGGYGKNDLWVARRPTKNDAWEDPVNLGPTVNGPAKDRGPSVSIDGHTLYFNSDSDRPGGIGEDDIWQVSIDPIVDLNSDGIVDAADMCIIVDYWGTDEPLCDIGPMPWGDGIVDVEDLIVLAEHLFEEFPPAE
jgi:Tol biopolymer transport system component